MTKHAGNPGGHDDEPAYPRDYVLYQRFRELLGTFGATEDQIHQADRVYRETARLGTDDGLKVSIGREERAQKWGSSKAPAAPQASRPYPGLLAILKPLNELACEPAWWTALAEHRSDRRRVVERVFGAPFDGRDEIAEVFAAALVVDDLADGEMDDDWARYVLDRVRHYAPGSPPPALVDFDASRTALNPDLSMDEVLLAARPHILPAAYPPVSRLAEALMRIDDKDLSRLRRCAEDTCGRVKHRCKPGLYPYFVDTTQARMGRFCCGNHRVRDLRSRKARR